MPLLESKNTKSGILMPEFSLKTADGNSVNSRNELGKNGLLIAFTCNHCPYAQAVWDRFIRLAEKLKPLGINSVAINPNINPDYPEDSPAEMLNEIKKRRISFPYLVDAKQEVARLYDAACTPDIYLLDGAHRLFYHGRIDDNWQNEKVVKQRELEAAAIALIAGKSAPEKQLPSMGCSIKWVE
jgi:peroxiredoxin